MRGLYRAMVAWPIVAAREAGVGRVVAIVSPNQNIVQGLPDEVQIVTQPPRRWSVVPRPKRARELPPEWGAHYAVCPSCRERAALLGRPRRLECVRCHGEFDVAWDEGYLVEA